MEQEKTYHYVNYVYDPHFIRSTRVFPIERQPVAGWDFSVTDQFLSKEECQSIIQWAENQNLSFATIYGNEDPVTEYRCVKETSLADDEFAWLYDRLANEIWNINQINYKYDLIGLLEPIILLKYKDYSAELGPNNSIGKYDWHRDTSGAALAQRKISTIIQLNDGFEYMGCELQLSQGTEPVICEAKDAGTLITFPSWRNHRVTSIQGGVRYSLVCWISGPPFR